MPGVPTKGGAQVTSHLRIKDTLNSSVGKTLSERHFLLPNKDSCVFNFKDLSIHLKVEGGVKFQKCTTLKLKFTGDWSEHLLLNNSVIILVTVSFLNCNHEIPLVFLQRERERDVRILHPMHVLHTYLYRHIYMPTTFGLN